MNHVDCQALHKVESVHQGEVGEMSKGEPGPSQSPFRSHWTGEGGEGGEGGGWGGCGNPGNPSASVTESRVRQVDGCGWNVAEHDGIPADSLRELFIGLSVPL